MLLRPSAAGDSIESEQVMEAVADLVAKSLVVSDTRSAGERCRLLDTTPALPPGEDRRKRRSKRDRTAARRLLSPIAERSEKNRLDGLSQFRKAETYREHVSNVRCRIGMELFSGG